MILEIAAGIILGVVGLVVLGILIAGAIENEHGFGCLLSIVGLVFFACLASCVLR